MSRLENLAIAVHDALDDSTVKRVMYRRREGRNGPRRRVHWYSEGGRLDTPGRAGGNEEGASRTPVVWSRYETVFAQVFAESAETMDALLDNLIVAISKTAANGSAILQGYTWDYDQVAQRTVHVELSFEVEFPVPDEQKALTTITDEEINCDFEED